MIAHQSKTTWSTKVVLLLLVGVMLLAPVGQVLAQGEFGNGNSFTTPDGSAGGAIDLDLDPFGGSGPVITPATPAQPVGQGAFGNGNSFTNSDGSAGGAVAERVTPPLTDPFGDSTLQNWLYKFVVNFFGWLVWAGGYLLDFAVHNFVINFGLEFNTSGVGEAVNELWSLVRDFFNILFIFGFIWIGFQMILDSSNSRAKQTLVSLIMAALLINFSLFISKFVVDFSNRLAAEVALAGFPLIERSETYFETAGSDQVSISNTFFAHLGISKTLDVPQSLIDGDGEPWAFIFGSAIFYLVAAFVFAAGGIMLIIRFVALSIFMVLSPFMFLGWVFPGMQGWTSKYWTGFLGRAFYAPVYIVLLFFAGTILQNMFGANGSAEITAGEGGLLSAVTNNTDNLIKVIGPFVLSAAFMLAAVIVAGKMSADGASGVMKVGNSASRLVRRNTIGLGAMGVSYAGRGLGKGVDKFDEKSNRNWATKLARGGLNTISLGATSHSSLKGITGSLAKVSYAGSRTADEYTKEQRERKKVRDRITTRTEDEAAIEAARGIDSTRTDLTDIEKSKLDKAEAAANRYTPTELEEMGDKKRNALITQGLLKAGTVSKLLDSDNLSVTEKRTIAGEYEAAVLKQVTANGEIVTEQLAKLTGKQLEILGNEFVTKYSEHFTESQMDDVKKSDAFTERQKGSQIASRKEKRAKIATSGTPAEIERLFKDTSYSRFKDPITGKIAELNLPNKPKKASEIAGLPAKALMLTEARPYITADVMRQISRNASQGKGSLSADEMKTLGIKLASSPGMNTLSLNAYLKSTKGQEDFFLSKAEVAAIP